MVKVEPFPGSLATLMLPPMSSQNFLVMTRPRPVPPYLRDVALSAC